MLLTRYLTSRVVSITHKCIASRTRNRTFGRYRRSSSSSSKRQQSARPPKLSRRSKVDLFFVVAGGFGTWLYVQNADWEGDVLRAKERLLLSTTANSDSATSSSTSTNQGLVSLQTQHQSELPVPMKIYLEKALPSNQKEEDNSSTIHHNYHHQKKKTFTVQQSGSFFAANEWYPFTSTLLASVGQPGFVFEANVEILKMPNRILQTYLDNHGGSITTKAWGKVPLIQVEEEEPYILFWLAMAPLCPTLFLHHHSIIEWNAIHDLSVCSAKLFDKCENETYQMIFEFYHDTKLLKSIKVLPPTKNNNNNNNNKKHILKIPWQVNYDNYQNVDDGNTTNNNNNVLVPTKIQIGKWYGGNNEFKPHMNIRNHKVGI